MGIEPRLEAHPHVPIKPLHLAKRAHQETVFLVLKAWGVPLKIFPFHCFQISQAATEKISMKRLLGKSCFAFWMVSKKSRLWSQEIPR
jgi:hypothetical protein